MAEQWLGAADLLRPFYLLTLLYRNWGLIRAFRLEK
jgi:hypothetical protein